MIALAPFEVQDIPVQFDADGHSYQHVPTGRYFPGVTTVMKARGKAWMGPWMLKSMETALKDKWKADTSYPLSARDAIIAESKGAHKKVSQTAREAGTDAHAMIADAIQNRMRGEKGIMFSDKRVGDAEAMNAVAAFAKWDADYSPIYLLSERPVCDLIHWYAGTLDVLAEIGGLLTVVDFKTSKDIYNENWVQLAAYQQALSGWINRPVEQRMVVLCPKDGQPYKAPTAPRSFDNDFGVFTACLTIHRDDQWWEEQRAGGRGK